MTMRRILLRLIKCFINYYCVFFLSTFSINTGTKTPQIITMGSLEYFLSIKEFNASIDITHLLPKLTTDWESNVHSYFLALLRGSYDVEVMKLNCNAVEFDKSLKQ